MIGRRGPAALLVLCLVCLPACSGSNLELLGEILDTQRPLDEGTVAAGLREALEVATGRSVDQLSSVDGFLGDALLRIAIPEQFETVATTLRQIGLGAQVNEFETAMNRAAERASAEARAVFWNEIRRLSIADAFAILNGGERAATDYFRGRTEAELQTRFLPIVQEKMEEVGLYRIYGELADRYNAIPFVTTPAIDLDAHITEGAMSGLFTVLGNEEARIRRDPVARSTELLRRVFGSR